MFTPCCVSVMLWQQLKGTLVLVQEVFSYWKQWQEFVVNKINKITKKKLRWQHSYPGGNVLEIFTSFISVFYFLLKYFLLQIQKSVHCFLLCLCLTLSLMWLIHVSFLRRMLYKRNVSFPSLLLSSQFLLQKKTNNRNNLFYSGCQGQHLTSSSSCLLLLCFHTALQSAVTKKIGTFLLCLCHNNKVSLLFCGLQ